MSDTSVEILLVEDNEGDARLTIEAMRDSKLANAIHHVRDGEEALEFLTRTGRHPTAPRPGIILLDLNLPRMNGQELLQQIKDIDELRAIPVVVLSGSAAEEDIVRSYQLHANCYVVKPLDLSHFLAVTRTIEDFWLSIVRLPSRQGLA